MNPDWNQRRFVPHKLCGTQHAGRIEAILDVQKIVPTGSTVQNKHVCPRNDVQTHTIEAPFVRKKTSRLLYSANAFGGRNARSV